NFGLISKGEQEFYSSGIIYDSTGKKFSINGANNVIPASFLESLRYFQPMERVDVNVKFIQEVSLTEFKNNLIEHVKDYPDYWQQKDLLTNIIDTINNANEFGPIINYMK